MSGGSLFMLIAVAMLVAAPGLDQVAAFGRGARSCQTAFGAENHASSYSWLMGFFSGLNTGLSATVGSTTDGDGIMAEVELACIRTPSMRLIEAAEAVYIQLRDSRR